MNKQLHIFTYIDSADEAQATWVEACSYEEAEALISAELKSEYDDENADEWFHIDNHYVVELENKDEIKITWCVDDVKSLDESLTDEQCRQVLKAVEHNHDSNVGINWDVLSYWVDQIKEDGN